MTRPKTIGTVGQAVAYLEKKTLNKNSLTLLNGV